MKKKFLSITMGTVLLLSTVLTGCGGNGGSGDSSAPADQPAANTAETTAAPAEPAGDTAAADAANATDSASDGEKVHLKWAAWDISLITYWNDLANKYMELNPNVEIELVDFGSNDYSNVLATELSGSGTDFDVVSLKNVPSYATLVGKGVLEPLDNYITQDSVDLAKYAGVTDQVTVDNSLYELPFRSDIWLVFYNKDVFDAKGLDYPTNDMTIEEYDALARAVSDDAFGEEVYGSHYQTWSSTISCLAFSMANIVFWTKIMIS